MRVNPSKCLECGELLDSATGVNEKGLNEEAVPEPGSFSVCGECGHITVFDAELNLQELSAEQAKAIAGDPVLLAIQRLRYLAGKGKKRPTFIRR